MKFEVMLNVGMYTTLLLKLSYGDWKRLIGYIGFIVSYLRFYYNISGEKFFKVTAYDVSNSAVSACYRRFYFSKRGLRQSQPGKGN